MSYEVAFDDDCYDWFKELDEKVQDKILARVPLLEERGPQLGRPHVDSVKGSIFANMKELRIQIGGDPWRILFAFDPRRSAILLVGGNKGGDDRWYKVHVPIADERFARHLASLGRAADREGGSPTKPRRNPGTS